MVEVKSEKPTNKFDLKRVRVWVEENQEISGQGCLV